MPSIPDSPKLCECGCQQPAPIATVTRTERGQVRGQPIRFIWGHNPRGKRKPPRPAEAAEDVTRIPITKGEVCLVSPEEASAAYERAAEQYFGEWRRR